MVLNFINYLSENNLENGLTKNIRNDIEFSSLDKTFSNSIILTTFNDFSNWARISSLWPLLYGTSCCFIEFASLIGSRFDFDRYGLVPRSSPRQADLVITAGTVTMKMAPSLVRLYEQMPEPKYVIAMGACTITGGMFSTDSYTTVRGVDKLIPVDIYLPGCPPKPEAIIDAIIKLRKRIAQEIYNDRRRVRQGERYFTINHQFDFLLLTKNMKKSDKNFSNPFFQFEKTSSELKLGLKKIEKKSEVFFSSSKKGMI